MDDSMRPNLFIVGAMKSGTSSLHEAMSNHPDIFMSETKEPSFFVKREELQKEWSQMAQSPVSHDIDAYLKLFTSAKGQAYRGESSSNYAKSPYLSGVPERIFEFGPDARILFVLRSPDQRAVSHYWHSFSWGTEHREIEEAISEKSVYVGVSDYAHQISRYLAVFPRKSIHVLLYEDLIADPKTTVEKVFRWLEIDTEIAADIALQHLHRTPKVVEQDNSPRILRGLKATRHYQRVRSFAPSWMRVLNKSLFFSQQNRSAVVASSALPFLSDFRDEQREKLRVLLDLDTSSWVK